MRAAGSVAVLLPGAFYALRDTQVPPIAALRSAGVPMAVSTDHNPGTSPTQSLLLMMNMACTLFRLTVPEALAGVTRHAAQALGLQATHGALHLGQKAQLVFWNVTDWTELAYVFGTRPIASIVRNGRCVSAPTST
jgi:imidazolonepropionase